MPSVYDKILKAKVTLTNSGELRAINYLDEFREIESRRGREAAAAYVREIAPNFSIAPEALHSLEQKVSYLEPLQRATEYRFREEKPGFDTVTFGYAQTFLNTPVWAAGVTATIKQAPTRVVAATNTTALGVNAVLPSAESLERYRQLFATAEKTDGPQLGKAGAAAEANRLEAGSLLAAILGKSAASAATDDQQQAAFLIRGRFYVYRYEAAQRTDAAVPPGPRVARQDALPFQETPPPTLELPPVPQVIHEGQWYVVAELQFRLPYQGNRMIWRALVEVETNTIVYLRALTSGVSGQVFTYDPISSTGVGANTPDKGNAVLNPLRDSVVLSNLNSPVSGVQSLSGTWAALAELSAPAIAAPTRPSGSNFDYDVRTSDFAAVNAYYHVDRFFQLVASLGFTLTGPGGYFDGTAFPVEVDHRGLGDDINARCVGDGDGIDHTLFALADTADTVHPIGIATDWRVVLHELGGHGILYDHVGTANFGFAHSAGDTFAMVLNDYLSEWHNGAAIDRYLLSPFVPAVVRRSDRTVADGWGWGGVHDVGGYSSEQILSTTLFRAYQSMGGDSGSLARREFAARCMAYLILSAVGTLTSTSNPGTPAGFLNALLAADTFNWTSEGVYGGAYGKLLTWSFEKQNLDGGARPPVDVYIDDGRAGAYQFQPVHWATTTIWNRRSPDGMAGHQEPALGETNYGYVRIKNRGTTTATGVLVKGYHCKPSAGVVWPGDLQPMTTAELSAGSLLANDAEEKIVGPFAWTPNINAWGHDCMMMIVSAAGDPSNVDKFTAGEAIEDWRLVPNDNNVGQRNVVLVPGGGGVAGLMAGLHGKGFWIGNPGRATATVKVQVVLPPLLAARGWRVAVNLSENGVRLKSGQQQLVTFALHAGAAFTRADVLATAERDIVVNATADGALIGGMLYRVDPDLEMPFNDAVPGSAACHDKAQQLLECLNLPGGVVKGVRVRKVAIDVDMEGDGCCN